MAKRELELAGRGDGKCVHCGKGLDEGMIRVLWDGPVWGNLPNRYEEDIPILRASAETFPEDRRFRNITLEKAETAHQTYALIALAWRRQTMKNRRNIRGKDGRGDDGR